MRDFIVPLISSSLVVFVSFLFSAYQQNKNRNNEILSEQYKYFVAPIYYLLTNTYNDTNPVFEIDKICKENPHLIPDGFFKMFTVFKLTYRKHTSIESTDFYREIESLYRYLRYILHYSKHKPTYKERKSAKLQLGKQPTLFGALVVSFGMGCLAFIIALAITALYQANYISYTVYYALIILISLVMGILDIKAMDRYYDKRS